MIEALAVATLPPGGSVAPDHLFRRPAGTPARVGADVTSIVAGRWQPRRRFDEARLDELAASIGQHGVLTALKVFVNEQGEFELIAGERRWRAAQRAGLDSVPVEIVEWTARQIAEVAIIDNLQRDDLGPDEEGAAFELAIDQLGISESELARRLGKGRTYIQQRRAVATAPDEAQEALRSGAITFSQLRGLLAGGGVRAAVREGLAEVLEREEHGRRCDEATCREIAYTYLIEHVVDDLKELGWQVSASTHYTVGFRGLVWDDDNAPAQLRPSELLALINDQVRGLPCDTTRPSVGTNHADTLRRAGYHWFAELAPPWIYVADRSGKAQWVRIGELANIVAEVEREIAALGARYEAAGYTLRPDGSRFGVARGEHWTEHRWVSFEDVAALIERLEAGYEPEERGPVADSPAGEVQGTCGSCGTKEGRIGYQYEGPEGHGHYCAPCHNRWKQDQKQADQVAMSVLNAAWQEALRACTPEALRLLGLLAAASMNGTDATQFAKKLLAEDNDNTVRNLVADRAAKALWKGSWSDMSAQVRELLDVTTPPKKRKK